MINVTADSRYKYYALVVLTSVYMLNLIDRGVMIILLQSIKDDLRLTDTQLGFVTGVAFGLFHAVSGIPFGRWADRGNRSTIASVSIGLWGLTVMSCVFIGSYAQLVIARVAAAVGESGCYPSTYSLLGEYFPKARERARAMGVYMAGSCLAALISFVAAGWLNERLGWRMTFLVMGIPGLILAIVVKTTIVDPRPARLRIKKEEAHMPRVSEVLTYLWNTRSCRQIAVALIVFFTVGHGLSPWRAVFMIRNHAMGTAELGLWLGLIFGIGGFIGALSGGYVGGRWLVGHERTQMRMTGLTVGLVVPFQVAFALLENRDAALMMLVPMVILPGLFIAPLYALLQRLVPDNMRATAVAVIMLLANLVGMGAGPQVVGILSDAWKPVFGADALRFAMMAMSLIGLWSAYHFWWAGNTVSRDLTALAQEPAARTAHEQYPAVPQALSSK